MAADDSTSSLDRRRGSQAVNTKTLSLWAVVILAAMAPTLRAQQGSQSPQTSSTSKDALYQTISELDAEFFGTFNHCDERGQLEKHASFMDADVEFYHDNGGVSTTRKDYIDKTRQNVCGKFRRKLTPGTLQVYPIKNFGAIEAGDQTFCDIKTEKCFGSAKFMFVWKQTPAGWQITRAFSYDHHAIE